MVKTHEEFKEYILSKGFVEVPVEEKDAQLSMYELELDADTIIKAIIPTDETKYCDFWGVSSNATPKERLETQVRPFLDEMAEFYFILDPVEKPSEPTIEPPLETEVKQEEVPTELPQE